MQSKDEIRVIHVAPFAIGAVWPFAAPFLHRGVAVDVNTSFKQVADGLVDELKQLWIITTGRAVTGAFLTTIHDDQNGRVVHVSTLSGSDMRHAATVIDDAMSAFADRTDCDRIRFCGRPGWGGLLPQYETCGEHQGHHVYERAVA